MYSWLKKKREMKFDLIGNWEFNLSIYVCLTVTHKCSFFKAVSNYKNVIKSDRTFSDSSGFFFEANRNHKKRLLPNRSENI
jgi:hypothetical protein